MASSAGIGAGVRPKRVNIFSLLAKTLFTFSVVLAASVFLYKVYLNYSIANMGVNLESARAALAPEAIEELIRLDNRIVITSELVERHRIISPVFVFLESSTPKTVRYTHFNYISTEKGLELTLKGQARGYAALALQAEILNKSQYFKNPIFSDLSLDDRGNVIFSFTALVNPELVSYRKNLERTPAPAAIIIPAATSTSATSSQATSTKPR